MKKSFTNRCAAVCGGGRMGAICPAVPPVPAGALCHSPGGLRVVYGIARLFCKDIVEEVPQEPKTTGNPELDQMIAQGQGALEEMRRLNDSIQDAAISAQIERLSQVSDKIFQQVQKAPSQLPQIRKFMSYYLPTTLKLLRAYDDMSRQASRGRTSPAPWSGCGA